MLRIITLSLLTVCLLEVEADLSRYKEEYDYDYDDEEVDYARNDESLSQSRRDFPTNNDERKSFKPSGQIDFTGCSVDEASGMCCVIKEDEITTLEKEPILECIHKSEEQCHYTYVTQFKPAQEEICEESFDKKCSISFTKQARNETVQKCYTPLIKVCGGAGGSGAAQSNRIPQSTGGGGVNNIPDILNQYGDDRRLKKRRRFKKDTKNSAGEQCRTYYETSCTTRYVEKTPGKFVADTTCEKLPVEFCGQGIKYFHSFLVFFFGHYKEIKLTITFVRMQFGRGRGRMS